MGTLFLLVIAVLAFVWALWPAISNVRSKSGNWFYALPASISFFALCGLCAQFWGIVAVPTGILALIALAFLVYAAVLRYQDRSYRFSDE